MWNYKRNCTELLHLKNIDANFKVKMYMISKKELKQKKQPSLRQYCIVSVGVVLLLNILVYFHALFSVINTGLIIFFLIFYFRRIKKNNTRKSITFSYIVSLVLCGSFSIIMFVLLIFAFLSAMMGNLDFAQLISTI